MEDKIIKDKTEKEKMAKEIGKDETQDDLSNGMQAVLDQRLHGEFLLVFMFAY